MFARSHALLLAAGLLCTAAAQADIGLTADLGTTGVGMHVVVPMESYLNGRFGFNGASHDLSSTSGGIKYELKGKLRTIDVLFDWYPVQGKQLRLTGGLVYNNNQLDAASRLPSSGTVHIQGTEYDVTNIGTLKGRIAFRKAAPYLGAGWGNVLAEGSRWHAGVDAGVLWQPNPTTKLAAAGCNADVVNCAGLNKELAAEAVRIRGELSHYKLYPVLRASIGYRF